jgi:hypothetical protein
MLKITNKRESYQSRAKNATSVNNSHKKSEDVRKYREDYKVDSNGYFVWDSGDRLKKV